MPATISTDTDIEHEADEEADREEKKTEQIGKGLSGRHPRIPNL